MLELTENLYHDSFWAKLPATRQAIGKIQPRLYQVNSKVSKVLLTSYNAFIRTHLDYDDMIYDQSFCISFQQKIWIRIT